MVLLKTPCRWDAIRIAAELANQGQRSPGADFSPDGSPTVCEVPSTNEDLSSGRSNGIRYRRYRKRAPNELWHVDLAGPFQLTSQKVYVLVVVVFDDSRFALAIEVIPSRETAPVTAILERLFEPYGTPKEILTDNSTTFASVWTTGTHPFDECCESHAVDHTLASPYDPESNGKAEALIKTGSEAGECLADVSLSAISIGRLQQQLEPFRQYDNFHRPHSGLGDDVPAGSDCNVRLTPTLRAVPQLASIDLPDSPVPENAPQIDLNFIHRHTTLVPMETTFSRV